MSAGLIPNKAQQRIPLFAYFSEPPASPAGAFLRNEPHVACLDESVHIRQQTKKQKRKLGPEDRPHFLVPVPRARLVVGSAERVGGHVSGNGLAELIAANARGAVVDTAEDAGIGDFGYGLSETVELASSGSNV